MAMGISCRLSCEPVLTAFTSTATSRMSRRMSNVDRDDLSAKFWLQPVGLARNFGFSPKELRRIQKLVAEHEAAFLEAWHGHLGAGG